MKEVNDGIAAAAMFRVTGWKVSRNIAVERVALKIALERLAMEFDAFDRACGG